MSRKGYRAKMRKKHGPDWWKKAKKAPAKESFKMTWPRKLVTKDGVELRYTKGYGSTSLYVVLAGSDEYEITPIGGGKYTLAWIEEDHRDAEDFFDDWSGDDYIPDTVDKTILKSATSAQIKRRIEGTNRPRLVKYNPRRRRNRRRGGRR